MKTRKKLLALLLTLCVIGTMFVTVPMTASAAPVTPTLKLGDYVLVGEYYGQAILWRVVSFEKVTGYDDAGNPIIDSTQTKTEPTEGYLPLLLADKILTIKAFDARGSITTGSHGRGYNSGSYRKRWASNYWGDSNIRDWLNADTAEVTWSCGNRPDAAHMDNGYNAYDNEAGFLYGFDNQDKSVIQPVTQKSLLDYEEYPDMSGYGTNYHFYHYDIGSVVQNYADAYAETVTDKMFLLDVKQINTVYNNSGTLGNNYYIGEPTAEAVANLNYKDSYLAVGKKWYFWLRSPYAISNGSYARYVYSDGSVQFNSADNVYYGVRPAFFLNLPSFTNFCGDGKSNNPYRIKNLVTYQGDYTGSALVAPGGNATLPICKTPGYHYIFTANGQPWNGTNITANVIVTVTKEYYKNTAFILPETPIVTTLGRSFTQNLWFSTDKTAEYAEIIVEYPKWFTPTVKKKEFYYVSTEEGTSAGDTKRLVVSCQYGNGVKIPTDRPVNPFDITFAVATDCPLNDYEVTIGDASCVIGDGDYPFETLLPGKVTVEPKKAERITVTGDSTVKDFAAYTATVSPDYTTDKSVEWSVDCEDIATIDQEGNLTTHKNGTVTVKATAKDGGGVYGTKSVTVKCPAKIDALISNIGEWDEEFTPTQYEYEIFVPADSETISLTPSFTGGTLNYNGGVWFNNREKSIPLTEAETEIVLNRSGVDGFTNSSYKIIVCKGNSERKVTVTGFAQPVELIGDRYKGNIMIGYYSADDILVKVENLAPAGTVTATPPKNYTHAKVMWWKDTDNLIPVCEAKKIEN